ncbi:MAG: nucleotidyl transferase AbiEii/AbiGii toxin family protein [Flammeovirgaceae bacterium]
MGLLKSLMNDDYLRDFNLVGGTALALHLGHRMSDDIDLFTSQSYELVSLKDYIQRKFSADVYAETSIGLRCYIQRVKTDFLNYPYAPLQPPVTVEGIRMLQVPDIASMKLSAINNRSAKRDFYDLYFLLQTYSLENLIKFFLTKYKINDPFSLIRSLTYFDDAEKDIDPVLILKKDLTWLKVKKFIGTKVNEYAR